MMEVVDMADLTKHPGGYKPISTKSVTPRRPMISYGELGVKVERLDTYRTMNPWWQRLWKPKYNTHLLAMTKDGIYDMCSPTTKECAQLFKPNATLSNLEGSNNG